MALSDSDINRLSERTADKLLEKRRALWVDPETHYNDHTWISTQKQSQADRKALKKKLIESAAIWALIIIIGFVCKSMYHEFVNIFLHKGP